MHSTKVLYVIKIRDTKMEWFIRVPDSKGNVSAGWTTEGWLANYRSGMAVGEFNIARALKSAMKYPTKAAAESVAFKFVARCPDLIGHVEVRRVVIRKKGLTTRPCRRR